MLFIAHRGASSLIQENTLKAFNLALSMGFCWLETDVQRTKDNQLVLFHDYSLKNGVKIKDLTYKQLSLYQVPKLADLLKILPFWATINLEIKNDNNIYPNIEKEIIKTIENIPHLNAKQINISSFDFPTLERMHKLAPQYSYGVLQRDFNIENAKKIGAKSINMSVKRITKEIVKTCHANNIKVYIYTIDEEKDLLKVSKLGVDAIFTNVPYLSQKNFFGLGSTN